MIWSFAARQDTRFFDSAFSGTVSAWCVDARAATRGCFSNKRTQYQFVLYTGVANYVSMVASSLLSVLF